MTPSLPKVAILILQWNQVHHTKACLQSLLSLQSSSYQIFVIDNGSHPDSLASLKNLFPQCIYVENKRNLGFAEGYNRGIKAALLHQPDFLFLLNNDTVVDPHCIAELLSAAHQYPEAGVFGTKIYYFEEPTQIWYAGGEVDPRSLRCYHVGCTESDLEKRHEQVRDTGYACGCALFIRKEVVEKVGMLDPRFFLLWEEIDWCWQIRKAGYRCLFIPKARVWHKISASFEGGNRGPAWQYFYFRNRLLFIQKHLRFKERLQFYWTLFPKEVVEILWRCLHPKTPPSVKTLHRAALRGIRHFFQGHRKLFDGIGQPLADEDNPT